MPSTAGSRVVEVAEDVGVVDHRGLASAEIGSDVVPVVVGPVRRAGIPEHGRPLVGEGDGNVRVHHRHQGVALQLEVLAALAGVLGHESGVDRRPLPRAARADAVGVGEPGRRRFLVDRARQLDQLIEGLGRLHAQRVEDLRVVHHRVGLEAPRQGVLSAGTERIANLQAPLIGGAQVRVDVIPVVVGIGGRCVLDPGHEILEVARRAVLPDEVRAEHEDVIGRLSRLQIDGQLFEVVGLGELVVLNGDAGQIGEGLQIRLPARRCRGAH